MMSRFALVGLAVATLAGPAQAVDTPAPPGPETMRTDPKPAPTRERVRRVARPASGTPPVAVPRQTAATPAAVPAGTSAPSTPGEAAVVETARPRGRHGSRQARRQVATAPGTAEAPVSVARADPPARPLFPWDAPAPTATTNPFATSWFGTLFGGQAIQPRGSLLPALAGRGRIDELVTEHARLNGVPEALVHRIIVRESKYNPRAVGRGGAMGLMQIKTGTARAMGYGGGPVGLLDAETNLTYGIKYLAGAYRTAGGDHNRAVAYYASGYYYAARRQGLADTGRRGGRHRGPRLEADATPAPAPAPAAEPVRSLFSFAAPAPDGPPR